MHLVSVRVAMLTEDNLVGAQPMWKLEVYNEKRGNEGV